MGTARWLKIMNQQGQILSCFRAFIEESLHVRNTRLSDDDRELKTLTIPQKSSRFLVNYMYYTLQSFFLLRYLKYITFSTKSSFLILADCNKTITKRKENISSYGLNAYENTVTAENIGKIFKFAFAK